MRPIIRPGTIYKLSLIIKWFKTENEKNRRSVLGPCSLRVYTSPKDVHATCTYLGLRNTTCRGSLVYAGGTCQPTERDGLGPSGVSAAGGGSESWQCQPTGTAKGGGARGQHRPRDEHLRDENRGRPRTGGGGWTRDRYGDRLSLRPLRPAPCAEGICSPSGRIESWGWRWGADRG